MTRVFSAPFLLTGERDPAAGVVRDGAVALDGDRIVEVGPRARVEARFGRGERIEGLILPALVNAHLHLELSHLRGRVPGGGGLAGWIGRLVAERARADQDEADVAIGQAVESLTRAGVAAVGEVTNTLAAFAPLSWAGFSGTLYHEVFGFSAERIEAAQAAARAVRERAPTGPPGLSIAESPHAIYSTHPPTVQRLLQAGRASIHLAEDPAERLFCAAATGPLAEIARALGARELRPTARSAVAAVAPFLGPKTLVVHGVDLDAEDVAILARSGATLALCPRSNLQIGGALPDLPRLLEAGVPLAIGTDSLASSPSLAPLGELALLHRAHPRVPALRLLSLAWNGRAVGASGVGRLRPRSAPGLLAAPFAGAAPEDPAAWLLERFGAEERPFTWIAQHRPEMTA